MRFNLTLDDSVGKMLMEGVEKENKKGKNISANDLIRDAVLEKFGNSFKENDEGYIQLKPRLMQGYISLVPSEYTSLMGECSILFHCMKEGENSKIKHFYVEKWFFDAFFEKEEFNEMYGFPSTKNFPHFFAIKINSNKYLIKCLYSIENFDLTLKSILSNQTKQFNVDKKFIDTYFTTY